MARRSDQWNMQTNLKDKPNAQGTLFSGGQRKPGSQEPRGFSPERKVEVDNAMGGTFRGKIVAPSGLHEATAQLHNTVARSTVPVSDLHAGTDWSGGRQYHVGWYAGDPGKGNNGVYNRPSSGNPNGSITVRPEAAASSTPIHELGHHVDREYTGRTPQDRGHKEGFADQYAADHARKPGYKSRPAVEDYVQRPDRPGDWHQNYGLNPHTEAPHFNQGYNRERYGSDYNPNLRQDQFADAMSTPKEHIKGQVPMVQKTVSGGWGAHPAKIGWQYAKPEDFD